MPHDKIDMIHDMTKDALSEIRAINKAMPTLATKKEHNELREEFTSFSSKVKAVGWIGAIIASLKAAWSYVS